jgi:hypothetical protein
MRPVTIGTLALFTSLVYAQSERRTEVTTTKTTWNGTLVDAACQSSRTERHESTHENTPERSTKTETTRVESVECPATTTTSSFGLLTSDGRFIRFDNPSNTRVTEVVRSNKALVDRTPLQVRVVGAANGDVAIVESLSPEGSPVGQADRLAVPTQLIFDVRYHDDRGKLVLNEQSVRFEDISEAKHSHTWTYGQIKELKRQGGNEIKIEPFSGDSMELHLEGPAMSDAVYNTIADRIVAARGH